MDMTGHCPESTHLKFTEKVWRWDYLILMKSYAVFSSSQGAHSNNNHMDKYGFSVNVVEVNFIKILEDAVFNNIFLNSTSRVFFKSV